MPSGRTHATITFYTAGLSLIYMPALGASHAQTAAFALGCLSGVVLTPDLDVRRTVSNMVMDDIGVLPGFLWELFWWPYSKFIPHRSIFSHGPILGTMLRILYLSIIIHPLYHRVSSVYLAGALAGLVTVDNLHISADWFVTMWRRRKRM